VTSTSIQETVTDSDRDPSHDSIIAASVDSDFKFTRQGGSDVGDTPGAPCENKLKLEININLP